MFGYRTVDDSAKAGTDYESKDNVVQMDKKDTEFVIKIPIIDDDAWQPDLDFFIELYDPNMTDDGETK